MSLNFDEFQNIQQRLLRGGRLIFPDVFFQELTYMEQIVVLWKTKQNLLKAGDNITLHENEDGTVTISAGEGGEEESYRIEEVAPTSGNSKAYALINATTGQQSGSTIQIPTAIKGDKGDKGDTGNGIEQVVLAEELPTGNKYRIDMTDGTFYYFTAPKGATGNQGPAGVDGFSPIAVVVPDSTGATVTITDKNGTSSVHINNGAPGSQGAPGADGVTPDVGVNVSVGSNTGTPTATVTKSGTAAQPVFTIVFDGLKGEQGIPGSGADGVGISNISLKETTAAGNTYTITLSNGQTYDFTAPVGPQGATGSQGPAGATGSQGPAGNDGFSPIATATRTGNTVVISITDANGTTSGTVYDGVSPTITVTSITGGHHIQIVTAAGTENFDVMDGTNGSDGISPTVTVTDYSTYHHVVITSAGGSEQFDIYDGDDGVGIASVTYNSQDAQGGNVYDVNLTNGTVAGQITAPKGDAASGGSVTVTPASNYGREVGSITSDGNTQTLYAGLPYPDNREVINIFTNETALSDYMQVTNITCYIPETAYAVPVQLVVWSSNNEVLFTCDMDVNIYYYDNDIAIMNSSAIVEATYPSGEYIVNIPQFTSTSGVWDTTNRLSIKPLTGGLTVNEYRFADMTSVTPTYGTVSAWNFGTGSTSIASSGVIPKVYSRVSILEPVLSGFKTAQLVTNENYPECGFSINFTATASASNFNKLVISASSYTPATLFYDGVGPDHNIYIDNIPVVIVDNNAANYLGIMSMRIQPSGGNFNLTYTIKTNNMPIVNGHTYAIRLDCYV